MCYHFTACATTSPPVLSFHLLCYHFTASTDLQKKESLMKADFMEMRNNMTLHDLLGWTEMQTAPLNLQPAMLQVHLPQVKLTP
jgi:hypothetical protein